MNPAFVMIKYYPKLGPFTNRWDDLVNDSGEPLLFGISNYNNTTASTFRARVKPQDVNAALVMLTYLFLEHHTVEDSLLFDSLVLLIKQSSEGQGVHLNSIGKPNGMFAWFVVDFLAMSILFDSFIDHCSLVAPMLFKKIPLSEEHCGMPVHNKHILIKFCLGQGLSRVDNFFLDKKTGDAGRVCVDLNKFGPPPPSFILNFMQELFPPLSRTWTLTPLSRRSRSYGSITL
jgi:hypothetical protein